MYSHIFFVETLNEHFLRLVWNVIFVISTVVYNEATVNVALVVQMHLFNNWTSLVIPIKRSLRDWNSNCNGTLYHGLAHWKLQFAIISVMRGIVAAEIYPYNIRTGYTFVKYEWSSLACIKLTGNKILARQIRAEVYFDLSLCIWYLLPKIIFVLWFYLKHAFTGKCFKYWRDFSSQSLITLVLYTMDVEQLDTTIQGAFDLIRCAQDRTVRPLYVTELHTSR